MSIVISYDSYMESMVMWDVYGRKDNHHDIELEQAECCRCRRWMTAFKVCKALPDDYSVTQVEHDDLDMFFAEALSEEARVSAPPGLNSTGKRAARCSFFQPSCT